MTKYERKTLKMFEKLDKVLSSNKSSKGKSNYINKLCSNRQNIWDKLSK